MPLLHSMRLPVEDVNDVILERGSVRRKETEADAEKEEVAAVDKGRTRGPSSGAQTEEF